MDSQWLAYIDFRSGNCRDILRSDILHIHNKVFFAYRAETVLCLYADIVQSCFFGGNSDWFGISITLHLCPWCLIRFLHINSIFIIVWTVLCWHIDCKRFTKYNRVGWYGACVCKRLCHIQNKVFFGNFAVCVLDFYADIVSSLFCKWKLNYIVGIVILFYCPFFCVCQLVIYSISIFQCSFNAYTCQCDFFVDIGMLGRNCAGILQRIRNRYKINIVFCCVSFGIGSSVAVNVQFIVTACKCVIANRLDIQKNNDIFHCFVILECLCTDSRNGNTVDCFGNVDFFIWTVVFRDGDGIFIIGSNDFIFKVVFFTDICDGHCTSCRLTVIGSRRDIDCAVGNARYNAVFINCCNRFIVTCPCKCCCRIGRSNCRGKCNRIGFCHFCCSVKWNACRQCIIHRNIFSQFAREQFFPHGLWTCIIDGLYGSFCKCTLCYGNNRHIVYLVCNFNRVGSADIFREGYFFIIGNGVFKDTVITVVTYCNFANSRFTVVSGSRNCCCAEIECRYIAVFVNCRNRFITACPCEVGRSAYGTYRNKKSYWFINSCFKCVLVKINIFGKCIMDSRIFQEVVTVGNSNFFVPIGLAALVINICQFFGILECVWINHVNAFGNCYGSDVGILKSIVINSRYRQTVNGFGDSGCCGIACIACDEHGIAILQEVPVACLIAYDSECCCSLAVIVVVIGNNCLYGVISCFCRHFREL